MNKIYVFTLGFHHYPNFSHLLLDFRRVVTFLLQAEGSLGGYEASEGITCFQGYALDRVHCTVVWNCHQWHGFFKVKVGVMCCSLIMRPLHLREKNSYFCQLNVNSAVFQIILGIDYECLFWILFMMLTKHVAMGGWIWDCGGGHICQSKRSAQFTLDILGLTNSPARSLPLHITSKNLSRSFYNWGLT